MAEGQCVPNAACARRKKGSFLSVWVVLRPWEDPGVLSLLTSFHPSFISFPLRLPRWSRPFNTTFVSVELCTSASQLKRLLPYSFLSFLLLLSLLLLISELCGARVHADKAALFFLRTTCVSCHSHSIWVGRKHTHTRARTQSVYILRGSAHMQKHTLAQALIWFEWVVLTGQSTGAELSLGAVWSEATLG